MSEKMFLRHKVELPAGSNEAKMEKMLEYVKVTWPIFFTQTNLNYKGVGDDGNRQKIRSNYHPDYPYTPALSRD